MQYSSVPLAIQVWWSPGKGAPRRMGCWRSEKVSNSLPICAQVKGIAVHVNSTSLKPEIITGVDMLVVRELTGGLYFGQPKKQCGSDNEGRKQWHYVLYRTGNRTHSESRVSSWLAPGATNSLLFDKANVLQTSRLWRQIVTEIAPIIRT